MRPPACSSDRIVETYRDHTSTARRQHVHGPLRSLANEARASGKPPIWKGMLILAPFVILLWFLGVVS